MAEMYKNIKTGVKAELVEINEKSKQVTLKKEDGKLTASNKSAFEKYWKKIDDNDPSSKKPSSKEKKEESKKEDKKPVEEKKPEKKAEQPKSAEAEKPKKEKKSRKPVVNNSENVAKIVEFINKRISELDGCDIGVPREELMQFRALRYQGKQFCKLMWSNKSVRLYFRSESVKKVADVEVANYNLPYLYIVESADKSVLNTISNMFDVAIADAKSVNTEKKNSKKEEKQNGEKVKKEEKKNGKNKVR